MGARLRIVLMADETLVAEIQDSRLWRRLHELSEGSTNLSSVPLPITVNSREPPSAGEQYSEALQRLADTLRISIEALKGACEPSLAPPYLHLSERHWNVMKSNVPLHGVGAFYSIAPAVTLLCLWFSAANLGNPTQAQGQAVLATIDKRDANPSRGVKHASWLTSLHRGQVAIRPPELSQALALARAYCAEDWSGWPLVG